MVTKNRPLFDENGIDGSGGEEKIKPHVLVMGLGNILLSDEGAGVKAIDKLQALYKIPETVEVIDGGAMGMELLPYFQEKSHLIIVDAVSAGQAPGTVSRIENLPAFFRNRISPHQIGLIDVLAFAELMDDIHPKIVLFGIEPDTLDTGLSMSPSVKSSMGALLSQVIDELRTIGINLQQKTAEKT